MNYIFTVCSNNYLAQATILGESIRQHDPDSVFIVFLCDKKVKEIDYTIIADEVIEVADIEADFQELVLRYNIIELNTAIKPRAVQYLFEIKKATNVIYLDPDIKIFKSLTRLYESLNSSSIILTPHIYTPIPIDNKKPGENTFLNYGIYNLGFIGLRNDEEANRFAAWWKNRTYLKGYFNPSDGLFVDQLPINHVPIFFNNVEILDDWGMNMAPWNLHERFLSENDGKFVVNETYDLVFYHFSSFRVDSNELPLFHYDRFKLIDRPDLHNLYNMYNSEMKSKKHAFYQEFICSYVSEREDYLEKLKKEEWKKRPFYKKIFRKKRK